MAWIPGGPEPQYQDIPGDASSALDGMSDAEIEQILGPAPAGPDIGPAESFDVSPMDAFLERIAPGLAGIQYRQPRGFAQGLVSGLTRGFGARGQNIATARQKFDQRQQARQLKVDEARRQATEDYNKKKLDLTTKDAAEARASASKQAEYERDNPLVTPEIAGAHPELKEYVGSRLPQATMNRVRIEMPGEAARGARQDAAAARADAAAQRAGANAERANRTATGTLMNQLVTEYRLDPLITGYTNVRKNLKTGEAGAQEKSGPGDIALIFAFMRALEPENPNAVREGEYTNARAATGLLQRFGNLPGKYFSGTQLTPTGRAHFLSQMRSALKSRRGDFDTATEQFKRRAALSGLDPTLIIREFPEGKAQPPVDLNQFVTE